MPPRRMSALALCALAAATLLVAPSSAQPPATVEHYVAAMTAKGEGDFAGYLEGMQAAHELERGHAILLRHIAGAHALLGNAEAAVEYLDHVADTGAYFDVTSMEDFNSLAEREDYKAVLERLAANALPRGEAEIVARIAEPDLVPEGIAQDPRTGALYISSIYKHKIVRVDPDGSVSDFIGPEFEGYYAGLGLEIAAERRELWAVSSVFDQMEGFVEEDNGLAALHCFDLDSGAVRGRWALGNDDGPRNLNDLTLGPDGRVYITDGFAGTIMLLEPGAETLVPLLEPGSVNGPNGIAISDDGERLYIAQYSLGLLLMDPHTGEFEILEHPWDVSVYGIDGLYVHDNCLIAVQNHPSLDRIARFTLSDDGRRITRAEELAARLPEFFEPTTGTLIGDRLQFLANTQIERFGNVQAHLTAAEMDEILVMEVKL